MAETLFPAAGSLLQGSSQAISGMSSVAEQENQRNAETALRSSIASGQTQSSALDRKAQLEQQRMQGTQAMEKLISDAAIKAQQDKQKWDYENMMTVTPELVAGAKSVGFDAAPLEGQRIGTKEWSAFLSASAAKGKSEATGGRQEAIDARQEKNLEVQEKGRFRNYFLDLEQRDPIIKEANKQNVNLSVVENMIKLVKEGNTVAFSGLGTKMAKAMGEVGVLTEQDIARYVRSGRLDRKAEDTLTKWIKGTPTEATRGEIAQIVNILKESYSSKIQPRYNQFIETYASIEEMTPEEFSKKIKLPYVKTTQTGGGAGGGGLSDTERAELAELEKKFGGGK